MDSYNHGATTLNRKDIDKRPYPMRIPGLELWNSAQRSKMYQASAGTTVANAATDPIGYFADVSGKKRHFLQTTDANRPLLVEKGGGLAPDFNGSTNLMSIAYDAVFDTTPFTAAVRVRLDQLSSAKGVQQNFITLRNTANHNVWQMLTAVADDKIYVQANDGVPVTKNIGSTASAISASVYYTIMLTIDAAFNAEAFVGTTSIGTFALGSLEANDGPLNLGTDIGTADLDGQISDTLFYSKALNTNEIAGLTQYLPQP